MSAVTAVETAPAFTEAPARTRLSETELRDIRNGHVVLMAGNSNDLTDKSGDAYYYTDGRVDMSSGTFSAYSLDVNGDILAWTTESVSRIVEHTSRDHGQWKRDNQWHRALGTFLNIGPSYLPTDIHDTARAMNVNLPRYATFIEVLALDHDKKTVKVRVFTNSSQTPDAVEFGETEMDYTGISANLLSREQFTKTYGLTKDVWPEGSLWIYEAEMYVVESNKGQTATFRLTDENTGEAIPGGKVQQLSTDYQRYVTKAASSAEEYRKTLPSDEVRKAVDLLSRNTVTRALKHADSNDYCKETAVALTSAGHVIPEIHVKGKITIDVDFTTKEYMFLRRAFGLANDDVSNLDAVIKDNYQRLSEQSGGKLPAMRLNDTSTFEMTAQVIWKTPKLRPLA